MVFEKIQAILAEQFDVSKNEITLDTRLEEDLGADSLDGIDVIMSIEDEFEIEVPEDVIADMKTVHDIVDYIDEN